MRNRHYAHRAGIVAHEVAHDRAQQADPNKLAVIVFMLYGATLSDFCRVIEKAIGGRHHA